MWEVYKKVLSPLLVSSSLEDMHTMQSSEIIAFLLLKVFNNPCITRINVDINGLTFLTCSVQTKLESNLGHLLE